jgi:hypothetical protein
MRDLLRALVPRAWTGEEALLAARVLRAALDAVWEVHGHQMAEILTDRPLDGWSQHFADDLEQDDIDQDDSPF